MANKNLKSITFPHLPDTYVVPQVDDTLAVAGRPADAKATGDEIADVKRDLSDKANTEGTYDGMTVGNARQLLSEKYLLDEEPYLFRASGGDGSDRVEECIVGGTVAWNQLVNQVYPRLEVLGITRTDVIVGDKKALKYSGTCTTSTNFSCAYAPAPAQHVLYITAGTSLPSGCYLNYSSNNETIIKPTDTFENFGIFIETGTTVDFTVYPMVFDLTQMFGSTIADYIYSLEQATAGAGVAWFKKYFPDDYYPYSAPTLRHVEGVSAKEVVGWNQWDEEWEVGGYNNTTGEKASATNQIRSKNAFNVIEGATYYFKSSTNGSALFFDFDGNYIGFTYNIHANQTFVVPSGIATMRFKMNASYGTTYNHDICINLSDPTKNGVYEPYTEHSYALDVDLELRGIPKLDSNNKLYYDGDIYEASGNVTRRYGVLDLGTIGYVYVSGLDRFLNESVLSALAKRPDNNSIPANIICARYVTSTSGNTEVSTYDKIIGISRYGAIVIKDKSFNGDTVALKESLDGVYLVYELATPTTEQADPYTSTQVIDPNGTEEFVSTGIVPVGHYSKYLENLRSKIEGLPRDFSTLIAPTEKEYKATRNYTVGSLLIVDNILYKVTSAIANGGTITPNTNVTATTLAAVIAAL